MLHMQHTPVVHCAQPKASAASHDAQLLSCSPPTMGRARATIQLIQLSRRARSERQQSLAWAVVF